MWNRIKWALALAVVPTVVGYFGCGLLDDPNIPDMAGPSTLAQSLGMRAIPDQLTADGQSSSVIEAELRDENGQPVAGQTIRFDLGVRDEITTGGPFQDIGNLAPLNAPRPTFGGQEARAVSAVTSASGVARARYWAPFRTDQANDIVVTVTGRPAGTDYRAARNRQVDIFLRAADRSEFPGGAECGIIVEPQKQIYKVKEQINFTATQLTGPTGQTIARYEWNFGDGTAVNGRRATHSYRVAGTYSVVLWTTEAVTGSITTCPETIPVVE